MMTDIERWEPPTKVVLPVTDSWVTVLEQVGDLAGKLAVTEFVPKAMQRRPASVAAAILTGREMGLGPMAALRGIDVIEGKPRVTAEMLAARILAAGHRIEWGETTDTRATVRIVRGDGLSEAEATWTKADAERAALWGKGAWGKYPRHMLRHRALTEAAGMACPDVALGLEVAQDTTEPVSPSPRGGTANVRIIPTASHVEDTTTAPPVVVAAEPLEPEPSTPTDSEPEPPADSPTPAQIRKLGAVLGDYAAMVGVKMDRDERRRFVGMLLGMDDLDSVKDLTRNQIGQAIDAIAVLLEPEPEEDQ